MERQKRKITALRWIWLSETLFLDWDIYYIHQSISIKLYKGNKIFKYNETSKSRNQVRVTNMKSESSLKVAYLVNLDMHTGNTEASI